VSDRRATARHPSSPEESFNARQELPTSRQVRVSHLPLAHGPHSLARRRARRRPGLTARGRRTAARASDAVGRDGRWARLLSPPRWSSLSPPRQCSPSRRLSDRPSPAGSRHRQQVAPNVPRQEHRRPIPPTRLPAGCPIPAGRYGEDPPLRMRLHSSAHTQINKKTPTLHNTCRSDG